MAANFGAVLSALQNYVVSVIADPKALQPAPEQQRAALRTALDAYIDARIDEKLKQRGKNA